LLEAGLRGFIAHHQIRRTSVSPFDLQDEGRRQADCLRATDAPLSLLSREKEWRWSSRFGGSALHR
jgi:hypothetical protein